MPETEDKLIQVSEAQLTALLAQNEKYKVQEEIIIECVFKSMELIGICDANRKMNEEVTEKKNYFKVILNTLRKKISFGSLIMGGKKAEAEIKEHFDYLKALKPIIDDYATRTK